MSNEQHNAPAVALPTGLPADIAPPLTPSAVVVGDDPIAWVIVWNDTNAATGEPVERRSVHLHNAVADYRAIDPSARASPLYARLQPADQAAQQGVGSLHAELLERAEHMERVAAGDRETGESIEQAIEDGEGYTPDDAVDVAAGLQHDADRAEETAALLRRAASALAATGKQQVGEVQGDARAQFEDWARTTYTINRESNGQYCNVHTEDAWHAWQAALAARQPIRPVNADEAPFGLTTAEKVAWARGANDAIMESAARQPGAQPYSIDADPAGIRARVADVITGTLMVGAQGHTPPPAGHWAEPFWQMARADAVAQGIDLGPGVRAIADERQRQVDAEGYSAENDADYKAGELANAALAYVQVAAMDLAAGGRSHVATRSPPACWPWHRLWWKPRDARRDLVRAGALIAAQLDLIDQRDAAPGVSA